MKIHEYQGKTILAKHGVPVPRGEVVFTPVEAEAAAKSLGGGTVVVKAQIHAGGRGKGGGVKVVKNPEAALEAAKALLGMTLVTYQTGPEGRVVGRVLVEEGLAIARELYLGLVIDRATKQPVLMVSPDGGVEIEKVAEETPDRIFKAFIHPAVGLQPFQARQLAFSLGLSGPQIGQAVKLMTAIYQTFILTDAAMVEINPLIVTGEGNLLALDAKIAFDDNALFRHPDVGELRDLTEEHPVEARAKESDLSYVSMDGTIGCMVNGAGLAMATMDIISFVSGGAASPANFLDVGGAADAARVTEAMRIILTDDKVRTIFVNIFGGIVKCDLIAEGIVAATKELGLTVPLVVRLEGTNVARGKEILSESGLNIIPADSMEDGARKAVTAAGKENQA
jgi:succinyl-CoA synthetase beta subunit